MPMDPKKMSRIDRFKALFALMFLWQRNVMVASKRESVQQEAIWEGYKKEDGASPTVATDSVIVTSVIEAHEKQDETTLDLTGAYLHTENDEHIIMLLKGKLAELLVQVDP